MAKDFESLKQQALVIKNEVEDGANSSERIGGILEDILDYNNDKLTELEEKMGYNGVISVNDEYRYAARCIRKIIAFTDEEDDVELYVLKYDESSNRLYINIKNASTKSQIGYFSVGFLSKPTGIVALICEPHQYYPNCALYAVIDFSKQQNVQSDSCHIVIEKMPKNSSAYFSLFEAKEQVEKHDEIINVVTDRLGISDTNIIDGWGDSLTAGSGGGGVTYLTKLQELVGDGFVVKNYGHGGETAAAIAFRQGGLKILLDPFSIVNGGQGTCTFKAINGMSLKTLYSNANGTQGIDNIYVGDKKLMFRTTANANECTLYNNKGAGDLSYDRPVMARAEGAGINHILIISMGQNGTADGIVDTDYRKLIGLYKLMISYNNYDKYIVAGIPTRDKEHWGELERLLGTEFGDHFFNSREYISRYGLSDNELSPTEEDTEAMEKGAIPPTLLSNYPTDTTHMNGNGYSSWGIGLYNRGKELGYW